MDFYVVCILLQLDFTTTVVGGPTTKYTALPSTTNVKLEEGENDGGGGAGGQLDNARNDARNDARNGDNDGIGGDDANGNGAAVIPLLSSSVENGEGNCLRMVQQQEETHL